MIAQTSPAPAPRLAPRGPLPLRLAQLLTTALVGGLLGHFATSIAAWGAAADQRTCAQSTSICLTPYVPGAALLVAALVLGGYLATTLLLRVPQGAPVAIGAAVLAVLLHYYAVAVAPAQKPPVWVAMAVTAFCLTLAVALRLWPTRVGVVVLLVGLLAAYAGQDRLRTYLAARHDRIEVQQTGLPQLHPDVPGYRLLRAYVPSSGGTLVYDLASTTAPLSAYSKQYGYIPTALSVQVSRIPADYRPPAECDAPEPAPLAGRPCTPAGPGRWSVSEFGQIKIVEERQGLLLCAYVADTTSRATPADLARALDTALR